MGQVPQANLFFYFGQSYLVQAETLRLLRAKPATPRDPLPEDILGHVPDVDQLDSDRFKRNVRLAKRGAAGGPSGMTMEHLRVLLDSPRDTQSLFVVSELQARGAVSNSIRDIVRIGRLTALQKPGDVVRRVVARTIAQQISEAVEAATAPFQYALTTKAGCECVAHAVHALTEQHPDATILSIDGVGAFDLISRESMLRGLMRCPGGSSVMPFVWMFDGQPSACLWRGTHHAPRGGGRTRRPPHPLLFSLGQHSALEAVNSRLQEDDKLMAFLDDVYVVNPRPDSVLHSYTALEEELWTHAGMRINGGKTRVWNRSGVATARV